MKKIVLLLIVFMFVFNLANFAEKPRIGVLRFTNTVAGNNYWSWSTTVAKDLQDMLISELVSTRAFAVLERKEINAVFSEQELSRSGRLSKRTRIKLGKIKGAQYLIAGTVSAFEKSGSKGGRLSFKGFSIGGKKTKIYIAVDVKVIDTTTGEIVDARTIEAKAKGKALGGGGTIKGFSFSGGANKKTATGKAIRACIIYISKYLKCSLAKIKYPRCMKKWDKMEAKRQKKTMDSIDLDD